MIHDDDDLGIADALSPGLRSLLDDGAEGPPLSQAASDRLLGRVLASVSVTGVAGASAGSAAPLPTTASLSTTAPTMSIAAATTATAGMASALVFKALLAVALAVAAVGVGTVVSRSPSPVAGPTFEPGPLLQAGPGASRPIASPTGPLAMPLSAQSPPSMTAEASVDSGPQAMPARARKSVSSSSSSSPSPSSPSSSSPPAPSGAWEVAQLEAARMALSRGDATDALALLTEHAQRAPDSSVAEERQALMVLVLAKAGRVDEAREAAFSFASRHPDSLFLDRVRAAVQ